MRQNTPHPKELRDKAKKLLAKNRSDEAPGISSNLDTLTEEVRIEVSSISRGKLVLKKV